MGYLHQPAMDAFAHCSDKSSSARSRRSSGRGDGGARETKGELKMPGFSQESGTAGTKKSCRCGRKIFTVLPTIKSSERGDLCT